MISETDLDHLRETVALAERGLFTTTPNPRVGCLIVRDGRVLGRGWHQWCGEAHAEINAIADAGGDVAGATVYVSLEPCTVDGHTSPCADALVANGVRRVVVGALDPNPKVNGRGLQRLREAGIEAENADLVAARELNPGFRLRNVAGRPLIRIKAGASLDGRTAMASGESQWITGAAARRDVQYWRARSCAVISGIGTVLADNPRLNVRDPRYAVDGRLRQPRRVIVDSSLRTPRDAHLFAEDGPVVIAHARRALQRSPPIVRQAGPNSDGAAQRATPLPPGAIRVPVRDSDAEGQPPQTASRASALIYSGSRNSVAIHDHSDVDYVMCGEHRVDLGELMDALAFLNCNEVLVEAGPTLAGALIRAGLWDELIIYLAPRLLGATARPLFDLKIERLGDAVNGRMEECVRIGDDLRLRLVRAGD